MQIVCRVLRTVLLGFFLFGISLTTSPAMGLAEEDADGVKTRLLEKKTDEWRIMRELRAVTAPTADIPIPINPVPTFTRAEDGPVVWLGNQYDHYVQVSSATELITALAMATPGDFIHLLDGIYQGNFVAEQSGLKGKRIALFGSRRAVLDGQTTERGYGLHLLADYWSLSGFTIRNASKGLMMDGADHTIIHGLEIYQIGDEALHMRRYSSHNLVEKVWIHDTGLVNPQFGEGIYIGSALQNWSKYTGNLPDRSDENRVIGNVLGPNLRAEGIDIKEGTTGGVIRNNSFLTDQQSIADSWIDIKGNAYAINRNVGLYTTGSAFQKAVDILQPADGWGQNNSISENQAFMSTELAATPFFVTVENQVDVTNVGDVAGVGDVIEGVAIGGTSENYYLILAARPMPYTLSELAAYFPDSLPSVDLNTLFVRENIFVGPDASLRITTDDATRIRLLSSPERYVNLTGVLSQITIEGLPTQRLDFESWDPMNGAPDVERKEGRAYLLAVGSRMDIDYAGFFDLGYEEGTVSGVAWKSFTFEGGSVVGRGDVTNSHFTRNYFGAYTFEAIEMRWIGNTFADNIKYGFDPHDFSNYFHVEKNLARNNGSHGIIFSRGCDYNLIRGNHSLNNAGHGIMIDDGKVVPDSDNERYHVAVPSNHNVIEDNLIVNNHDGIVLEGGGDNIIRNNTIIGPHRYGLRFKDDVRDTLVISNTIENSERFGIFVYNHSTNNRFQNNVITYGSGGVAFQDAPQTIFTSNIINHVRGSAVTLRGDLSAAVITDNKIGGSGVIPLRMEQSVGLDESEIERLNDFSQWRFPPPTAIPLMIVSVWSVIFLLPIVMTLRRTILRFV